MKVLALDFDGVLADSQMECLFVGYNSYLKFHKDTKLFSGERFTFNNFNRITSKNKSIISKYKKLRPYVIDAFCFNVILHSIENKIKIKDEKDHNNLRKKLMKDYKAYVKEYYIERNVLQKKSIKKWMELVKPFPKIINSVKKLKKDYIITISTNNRKKFVKALLDKFKIKPLVIVDSIYNVDKKFQLKYIKKKLKVSFNDIYFIDDNVGHFPNPRRMGVNCYFASWGYNNQEHKKHAKKLKVGILNQENFYSKLAQKQQNKPKYQ